MTESVDEFAVTTGKSRDALNEKQLINYRAHRERFFRWLIHLGKNSEMTEGYSRLTAKLVGSTGRSKTLNLRRTI